jgi:hypothetical protein
MLALYPAGNEEEAVTGHGAKQDWFQEEISRAEWETQ